MDTASVTGFKKKQPLSKQMSQKTSQEKTSQCSRCGDTRGHHPGKMEGEYTIVLKPGAKPFSLSTPRRISLPLMPKVKEELSRMVEEPTAWCAPMVVVPKSSGRVRICTDLTELNNAREANSTEPFTKLRPGQRPSPTPPRTATASEAVIEHFKSIFAHHGIPDVVRSDNGPQFASEHFRKFAQEWGFDHVTSSPHFAQSNGEAEWAVRTIKGLLKKSSDPYLALMAYRAAALANGHSPAELLMGRKIRTPVPVMPSQLNPGWTDMDNLRKTELRYKMKQKEDSDRHHRAHNMPPLQDGDHIWVKDILERGTVVSKAGTPRSYMNDE
ncbi:hypothetical protein ACEWY4_014019 [Coilia grayii]|uniref:Integrase catalytic domain-containing protein n=1 Tax=Coilia grayii TaxID=363190 RepID=A0ABD1JR45_9TELE